MRIGGLLAAAAALVLSLGGGAWAQSSAEANRVVTPHVETELVSSRAAIAPGETFTIALRQRIIPDWHTYWLNAGDSGEPTELTWTLPPGFTAGPMRHPAPVPHKLEIVMTFIHENEILYPVEVTAPALLRPGDTVTLAAHAYWLVCSDICLTEEGDLTLTLPVAAQGADDPVRKPAIDGALASLPRDANLSARISAGAPARLTIAGADIAGLNEVRNFHFFPYSRDAIEHIAPQSPEIGAEGVSFALQPGAAGNLGQVDLDGIIAFEQRTDGAWARRAFEVRATPGEALPGTSGRPAPSVTEEGAPAMASTLSLPLALLFAFIGGLILNVMPCVLPVLSMKAVSIARTADARRDGLFYLAGVLTTFLALAGLLIALRAGGQSLGWAFQLQEPWLVGALALLFFAIGLNLLGAFEIGGADVGGALVARGGAAGAFFTGALAVIVASPCTAPFMAGAMGFALANPPAITLSVFAALGLGFAAPLVALSFAPALQNRIPKPGPWMERFRNIMAFPMFAAAIWLAWVLSAQSGPDGVLLLLAAAAAFALIIWALRAYAGWRARGAVAAIALLLLAGTAWAVRPSALVSEAWSAERVAELRAEGRPIFVNFTADWCVTCKVNEGVSLSSERVARAFQGRDVAYLKGDWTNRDAAIAAELERHGRAGVPLYLYYAPNAEPRVLPQMLSEQLLIETISAAP